MTLTDRQCLHTERIGKLLVWAKQSGIQCKVVEWNRLLVTQQEYVAKGVSKTLNSEHLNNCATDIYIIVFGVPTTNLENYRPLGVYWESLGGRWGGRFHSTVRPFNPEKEIGWDPYHMETPP